MASNPVFFFKPDVKRVKRVTNVLSWVGYLHGSSKEKIYSGRPGPYYTRGFPCGQPGWRLLTRSVTNIVKTAYYRAMAEKERERKRVIFICRDSTLVPYIT